MRCSNRQVSSVTGCYISMLPIGLILMQKNLSEPPEFEENDCELINKSCLFKGFFKLEQYELRHRLFAGGFSETYKREIFERGNAACVLLWDPNEDKVVLIEQFRIGALEHPHSPWLIELVAGMIEDGETPQAVVKREAIEEAGIKVEQLSLIGSYLASPGGSTERVWLYIGKVDSNSAGGIHGLESEHEDIRVHVLKRKSLMGDLFRSRLDNAATIIALQWLELNSEKQKADWENEVN